MGKTPGAGGVALGSWPAGIACGHSSAEGLKDLAAEAHAFGPDSQGSDLPGDLHPLKGLQIPLDIRPFQTLTAPFEAAVPFLAQDGGQKAAEDTAPCRLIPLTNGRADEPCARRTGQSVCSRRGRRRA